MTTTRRPRSKLPASLRALTALDALVGLTALYGGIQLLRDPSGGTLGLPLALLERTPFTTYSVPGLILAVIVGAPSLLAGLAHLLRARLAGQASLFAGLVLVGWIGVQAVLIRDFSWLQGTYLVIGLAQMALALRALSRASG